MQQQSDDKQLNSDLRIYNIFYCFLRDVPQNFRINKNINMRSHKFFFNNNCHMSPHVKNNNSN